MLTNIYRDKLIVVPEFQIHTNIIVVVYSFDEVESNTNIVPMIIYFNAFW